MTNAIESRLRGLRERRLICLRELEVHLARGNAHQAGVSSCIEKIERINAEMLRVASSTAGAHADHGDVTSGL